MGFTKYCKYKWYINDGEEVFAFLDGTIKMFYKENGVEKSEILESGDIFYATLGTEHFANPNPIFLASL